MVQPNEKFIPEFVAYGSPVNSKTMEESLNAFGLKYAATYTNEGDSVAIVLGGNKGENEQATLWERIGAVQYIVNLNKAKYPYDANGNAQPVSSHSTYGCQKNCGHGEGNEQGF